MSFDETIIHCAAPSLCGIKPASLFSMDGECYNSGRKYLAECKKDFSRSKKYFVPLKKSEKRILFFVFDKKLLEEVCSCAKNSEYLRKKGYPTEKGFGAVLSELLHRLMFSESFPHEVGIFLGYPLEDVIGFENDSSKFKYSGFWKVYGDIGKAEKQMQMYKACTKKCMDFLEGGNSLVTSIKRYKKFSSDLS
ncbi:MAG: DUF3793 family protein [Treponema sp.]|nr:DUF3793 family protein [Treponema sp.]